MPSSGALRRLIVQFYNNFQVISSNGSLHQWDRLSGTASASFCFPASGVTTTTTIYRNHNGDVIFHWCNISSTWSLFTCHVSSMRAGILFVLFTIISANTCQNAWSVNICWANKLNISFNLLQTMSQEVCYWSHVTEDKTENLGK